MKLALVTFFVILNFTVFAQYYPNSSSGMDRSCFEFAVGVNNSLRSINQELPSYESLPSKSIRLDRLPCYSGSFVHNFNITRLFIGRMGLGIDILKYRTGMEDMFIPSGRIPLHVLYDNYDSRRPRTYMYGLFGGSWIPFTIELGDEQLMYQARRFQFTLDAGVGTRLYFNQRYRGALEFKVSVSVDELRGKGIEVWKSNYLGKPVHSISVPFTAFTILYRVS